MGADSIDRRDRELMLVAQLYTGCSLRPLASLLNFHIVGLPATDATGMGDLSTNESNWPVFDDSGRLPAAAGSDGTYPLQEEVGAAQAEDAAWHTPEPPDIGDRGFDSKQHFFEIDDDMLKIYAVEKDAVPISGGGFGGTGHGPVAVASKAGDGGIAGTGNTGGSGDGGIAGTGNDPASPDGGASGADAAAKDVPSTDSGAEKPADDAETKAVTGSSSGDSGNSSADAGSQQAGETGEQPEISYFEDMPYDTAGSALQPSGDYFLIPHISYTPVDSFAPAGGVFPV